jgi:hypothetical protein
MREGPSLSRLPQFLRLRDLAASLSLKIKNTYELFFYLMFLINYIFIKLKLYTIINNVYIIKLFKPIC